MHKKVNVCVQNIFWNEINTKINWNTEKQITDYCFHNMVDNPWMADIIILYFNILYAYQISYK